MAATPHRYEKRITVTADGSITEKFFSWAYVFTGSRNDCDINELQKRPISAGAYAAAKRRGGYQFETTLRVASGIPVERF